MPPKGSASLPPPSSPDSPLLGEFDVKRELYSDYSRCIEILIRDLLGELVTVDIASRTKDRNSLRAKLKTRQHKYASLNDIPDLSGVRVIGQTIHDVTTSIATLSEQLQVIEQVSHGSTDNTDTFGYASQHLIIELKGPRVDLPEWKKFAGLRCEIQVRTILQHAWASISHTLDYKTSEDVPSEVRRALSQVAALIEVGDGLFEKFRQDVSQLKNRYLDDADAPGSTWRALPVNLDSLAATWQSWRPAWLVNEFAGEFPKYRIFDGPLVEGTAYPQPEYLSSIVEIAIRRDLATVGHLEDFLRGEAFRKGVSQTIVKTTPEERFGVASLDFLATVGAYQASEG